MEAVRGVQWIPEDDLLLKDAVERGASLEALAKGAEQFSRRYSLQELRERWYSLLYDDDISAQASYSMFELEISGVFPASKYRPENGCERNKDVKEKRKSESIRKKYYAMRKRLRAEYPGDMDMDFLESSHCVMPGGDHVDQIGFFGESVPGNLGFEEEDLDILMSAFPEAADDVSVDSGDATVAHCVNPDLYEDDHQNGIMDGCGFTDNLASSSVQARDDTAGGNLNGLLSSVKNDAVDENLPNPLVGFDATQQYHSPNPDCFSSFDTMMLACEQSPLQPWTEMQDVESPALPASMGLPRALEGAENLVNTHVEKETNEAVNEGEIGDPDSLLDLPSEVEALLVDFDEKSAAEDKCSNSTDPLSQKSSGSSICGDVANVQSVLGLPLQPDFVIFSDGKICCVLNTEDLEIPCNDDIFLLIHPPSPSFPSERQPAAAISPHPTSSSPVEKEHEAALNLLTKETTKSSVSLHTTSKVAAHNLVKKEVHGLDTKVPSILPGVTEIVHSADTVPAKKLHREFVNDSQVSDDENSQMDCDVPYFSDVEALILEMDLGPFVQDSNDRKVPPSYQCDETKRTIIRLEQGARSCLQRDMTSRGAYAILYGRYLRHYIRKTEVLLGRSTDDIAVDIDLAQEGRANKISRRQAIIKMEPNGSFFMKNLGRSSISLNGTALLSGQVVSLCSGCLIEIKGMNFVFEINHGYVKHLGNPFLNTRKEPI